MVSMVVLARLLTPADFGIIAMASLAVGLIDVLLDLGVNIALIQNSKADDDDYNTAWSLRLIQACLAGLLIILMAPIASEYYNNPNVTDVLRVMAVSVIIAGLENIGIVTFQKNMEFGLDFKFFFFKRVVGFLITLFAAFLLHSYWAMVLGSLAGRVAGVLLSYGMHPFRPRFSLIRLKHIWSFSQWVLVKNIGSYFDNRLDQLFVGRITNAATTGTYTVAGEIAALPSTELLAPLGRVLFPAFIQQKNDPVAFARIVSISIGVQGLVAIPACIGLALVSHDAVFVLLGAQWVAAAPIIQIMAITNLCFALIHTGGYALLAIGKIKILAFVTWLQAILFLITAVLLVHSIDAIGLATIRMAALAFGSVILIGIVIFKIPTLSIKAFFYPLIRPAIATILMTLLINSIHPSLGDMPHILRLVSEIAAGSLAYSVCIISFWLFAGRPEGAESYLLRNIKQRFG